MILTHFCLFVPALLESASYLIDFLSVDVSWMCVGAGAAVLMGVSDD